MAHRRTQNLIRPIVAALLGLLGGWSALRPALARADALGDLETPFRTALEAGDFAPALGMIFVAGVATSLTPCVYPMIVITVSIFGARQVAHRGEAALLSTAFVLGIAALFTPLGLFAAVTGDIFGAALSSPWVRIGLAGLFVALAVSMFGGFSLDLPPMLKNRLAGVGGKGLRGAFALGLVSALIAAPCTGPVLGFLLTWVGTSGHVGFGALALFVYALGLGMLFWLVGTFSIGLPKSGAWLEIVKSTFGILMIVAALYYLRGIVPGTEHLVERAPFWLAAGAIAALLGLALGAVHLSFHTPSRWIRGRKALGVVTTAAGLSLLIAYLEAAPPGARMTWMDSYEAAKARALSEGKPMLVDFGADWCGACGELDRHTFTDPRVVREGRRFVSVRVDLSPGQDSPEKRALLAGYDQRGLPLVVLHGRDGHEVARITRFVGPEDFLALMRQIR